ncbi:MAG: hypothetical protein KGJ55_04720 [Gammaproteobacteria bacterium]|nr:hypothetical protein [Gammaproteobacteria bacterium]
MISFGTPISIETLQKFLRSLAEAMTAPPGLPPPALRQSLRKPLTFLLAAPVSARACGTGKAGWRCRATTTPQSNARPNSSCCLDLIRLPASAQPDADHRVALLARERQDVLDDNSLRRQEIHTSFGTGLILLVLALRHYLLPFARWQHPSANATGGPHEVP